MPMFALELMSDEDLEAIWHYVRTMAEVLLPAPRR